MRPFTSLFAVNGKPLLVPDAQVQVSYEDIDAADSGRDEAGVMHRYPVRYKVAKWSFSYSHLTEEERQYMESLFPDAPNFTFHHPSKVDARKLITSNCYRSKFSISWFNAEKGLWSGYGFHIIEC